MWKKTNKWRPARFGGSGAIPVEWEGSSAKFGLAKPNGMINEKIASDLAALVGVRVPPVDIDIVDGGSDLYSISYAHGRESVDVTLLQERAPEQLNSQAVRDGLAMASGLLPFYAWTASGDFKNDHLVLDPRDDGTYEVAGIDFQHSFGWGDNGGGDVQATEMPPALAPNIDKNVVLGAVSGIEAVTDGQIRDIVNTLPALIATEDVKTRLIGGLIGRRDKVRNAMQNKGWLP